MPAIYSGECQIQIVPLIASGLGNYTVLISLSLMTSEPECFSYVDSPVFLFFSVLLYPLPLVLSLLLLYEFFVNGKVFSFVDGIF